MATKCKLIYLPSAATDILNMVCLNSNTALQKFLEGGHHVHPAFG